ncbi:hypothetical protein ABBQ38_010094 [Trebouxia sp. C0009 RCD-2024]
MTKRKSQIHSMRVVRLSSCSDRQDVYWKAINPHVFAMFVSFIGSRSVCCPHFGARRGSLHQQLQFCRRLAQS